MADMKVETKNNDRVDRKPRVYFTCHPEDLPLLKKIREDIFRSHDCAIYYTADMAQPMEEADLPLDIGRANLVVVPVTFRLLTTPNRTMDRDLPYARQEHIPILPVMMEEGLDEYYSQPDKFGELQYIDPFASDPTAISYEEKLKKYLESVLISDRMARRIRAAFDAYIFLSYRKKDRRYANELMRLIHSHPECRDIAIWYDEFLTPGESFKESIDKILQNSKLFALLVTPHLLEETDGKPNFVMGEEYPAAKRSGISILPAEMEHTDKDALNEKFEGLPTCMDPRDEAFRARLLEQVARLAIKENDTPEHDFLIGLAYLDGIDVETDRPKALSLITGAAEAGLPEAMDKLFRMYRDGASVPLDYGQALVWARKRWEHHVAHHGKTDTRSLLAMNDLGLILSDAGMFREALEVKEELYALRCQVLGPEHPDTLNALNNLAVVYGEMGDHEKSLELREKAYHLRCQVLGPEHPDTLVSLSNLAVTYTYLQEHPKALELRRIVYDRQRKKLGDQDPKTRKAKKALIDALNANGDHIDAALLADQ